VDETVTLPIDLLRFVDERIARATPGPVTQFGTVVSVASLDFAERDAMVVRDDAQVATPARVAAGVVALPGDRCIVTRVGTVWVLTEVFTRRWQSETGNRWTGVSGNTTSSSEQDVPGSPSFTFVKRFDDTQVRCDFAGTSFVTVAATTQVMFSLDFSGTHSVDVAEYYFNATSDHRTVAGIAFAPLIEAGVWTVTVQWRRMSGTGTVSQNSDDFVSAACREIEP
jgi:hypothetical protein